MQYGTAKTDFTLPVIKTRTNGWDGKASYLAGTSEAGTLNTAGIIMADVSRY
jgi:hypothetical protein